MKTPVALFIFKRPHTTEKVFEAIRQAKPPKLFLIAKEDVFQPLKQKIKHLIKID